MDLSNNEITHLVTEQIQMNILTMNINNNKMISLDALLNSSLEIKQLSMTKNEIATLPLEMPDKIIKLDLRENPLKLRMPGS